MPGNLFYIKNIDDYNTNIPPDAFIKNESEKINVTECLFRGVRIRFNNNFLVKLCCIDTTTISPNANESEK